MQMALTSDGGMVSEPYQWFENNRSVYRYIEACLDGTREAYLDAGKGVRTRLLFDSATYGLLTANAPLYQADSAFEAYTENRPPVDEDTLAEALKDAGIGYYNNRSGYICDNYCVFDDLFDRVDSALESDDLIEAQQLLMEAKGLGPAKSAFSLAMLGFTDMACLDTNVCQQLDVDPRSYDKHTADQYQALVDEAFSQVPDLADEVSPFLLQWILFDVNRGHVEPHRGWFAHVNRNLEPEGISDTRTKE